MPPPDPLTRVRHVVGCMTGTSLDGLDVALVRITGTGLNMDAALVGMHSVPLAATLRDTLSALANGTPHTPLQIMRAARHLGVVHAQAVATLLARHRGVRCDFVVAHGQTIWHAPADRLSWQLFDPWPLVRTLGRPVCHDLRQADLVAGGEGAPITPLADWVLYRRRADAVINLGGIANLTLLHDDPARIEGSDRGPCNLLLDGLCRVLFEEPFDVDGRHAASGKVDADLLYVLSDALDEQRRGGSMGREQYSDRWIGTLAGRCTKAAGAYDILRTATHVVAVDIAAAPLARGCRRWVAAGGGARHPVLLHDLREAAGSASVVASDELGIPCEAREAMAFAVLGALSQDGVPITLPRVTGATSPGVAGVWAFPGRATQPTD